MRLTDHIEGITSKETSTPCKDGKFSTLPQGPGVCSHHGGLMYKTVTKPKKRPKQAPKARLEAKTQARPKARPKAIKKPQVTQELRSPETVTATNDNLVKVEDLGFAKFEYRGANPIRSFEDYGKEWQLDFSVGGGFVRVNDRLYLKKFLIENSGDFWVNVENKDYTFYSDKKVIELMNIFKALNVPVSSAYGGTTNGMLNTLSELAYRNQDQSEGFELYTQLFSKALKAYKENIYSVKDFLLNIKSIIDNSKATSKHFVRFDVWARWFDYKRLEDLRNKLVSIDNLLSSANSIKDSIDRLVAPIKDRRALYAAISPPAYPKPQERVFKYYGSDRRMSISEIVKKLSQSKDWKNEKIINAAPRPEGYSGDSELTKALEMAREGAIILKGYTISNIKKNERSKTYSIPAHAIIRNVLYYNFIIMNWDYFKDKVERSGGLANLKFSNSKDFIESRAYIGKIAKPNFQNKIIKKRGNTNDIIQAVLEADKTAYIDTKEFSKQFERSPEGLKKLWEFVKYKIKYKEDPKGVQWIQSPARLYSSKIGDCKSKTIFVNSILKNLSIPYKIRFISQKQGSRTPTHVYTVANLNGQEIVIDTVYKYFNKEPKHTYKQDYTMTEISYLSGLNDEVEALKQKIKNFDFVEATEAERQEMLTKEAFLIEALQSKDEQALSLAVNYRMDTETAKAINELARQEKDAAEVGVVFMLIPSVRKKIITGISKVALPKMGLFFLYSQVSDQYLSDKAKKKKEKQEKFIKALLKASGMTRSTFDKIIENGIKAKTGKSALDNVIDLYPPQAQAAFRGNRKVAAPKAAPAPTAAPAPVTPRFSSVKNKFAQGKRPNIGVVPVPAIMKAASMVASLVSKVAQLIKGYKSDMSAKDAPDGADFAGYGINTGSSSSSGMTQTGGQTMPPMLPPPMTQKNGNNGGTPSSGFPLTPYDPNEPPQASNNMYLILAAAAAAAFMLMKK